MGRSDATGNFTEVSDARLDEALFWPRATSTATAVTILLNRLRERETPSNRPPAGRRAAAGFKTSLSPQTGAGRPAEAAAP